MPEWSPLPELAPPPGVDLVSLCPLPRHSRVIWAEGAPSGMLMVVLDNPGAREDREGMPFLCGTRQTLLSAAVEAGLRREELYVTWVLKCRPLGAYEKERARKASLPYLQGQVEEVKPRLILLLGNVVLQTLLGQEAEVKALRGQVLSLWGHPAVCSYHPLAARRRPNLLPYLMADLGLAAQLLVVDG